MQVSLKRHSWHYSLQRYVFGYIPFAQNFCPYFWLTLFCMFAVPFVAGFKPVNKFLIKPLLKTVNKFLINPLLKPLLKWLSIRASLMQIRSWEKSLQHLTVEDVAPWYAKSIKPHHYGHLRDRAAILLQAWMARASKEDYKRVIQVYNHMEEIRFNPLLGPPPKAPNAVYLTLIKYTRILFIAITAVVVSAFVGGIGYFVWYLIKITTYETFIANLKMTAQIFAVLGGLSLVIMVLYKGLCCLSLSIRLPKCVGEFFGFFWLFIRNFKKDHCPAIHWD